MATTETQPTAARNPQERDDAGEGLPLPTSGRSGPSVPLMQRWAVVLSVLLLASPLLGVIVGERTLFFRDVSNLHLPAKWSQAQSWSRGEIPVLDLQRAGGQPSLGNPNLLPLYPDNLLYLVSPTLWAFNAHYWLHLLLAPLACAWLGRSLGLDRRASWAMGLFYAASGFYLSQLNFYNLVAVNALLPAFLAALLAAARARRRVIGWAAGVAVSFGLLLLAGDPMLAALGVVVGGVMLVLDRAEPRRGLWLTAALLLGVGMGLPQHLEFLRILPESYRAYIGYSASGALVGSWDPRQMLEWLVPFAFGRPDSTFWGAQFFGGVQPFFFSLYPGVLLLGCLALAGRPRDRWHWLAWAGIVLGLFVASGAHNPVLRWLVAATVDLAGGVLRFPIKFWILAALGSSYLAAVGWRRAFSGRRGGWAVFAPLLALHLIFALALRTPLAERLLVALAGEQVPIAIVIEQWSRALAWATCAAAFCALAAWMAWRRSAPGRWAEAALLVHVAVQVVVLKPLLPTDDAQFYARPSPLLQAIEQARDPLQGTSPSGAPSTLVQGNQFGAFGAPQPHVRYPDRRALWIQRRGAAELFPFSGVRWGLHYETNVSADGLDHFASHLSLTALRGLDDVDRVQLLRCWGVDWLVLDRQLRSVPARFAKRVAALEHFDITSSLYRLLEQAPAALVSSAVLQVDTVGAARAVMLRPEFDPRQQVVLLGYTGEEFGQTAAVMAGKVLAYREESGPGAKVTLEVEAPTRSVVQLSRAYQPHYRAWVDGRRAETLISNLSRLAVAVQSGRHVVEFEVARPRRGLWWAIALVCWAAGIGGLLSFVPAWRRARQLNGARGESRPLP